MSSNGRGMLVFSGPFVCNYLIIHSSCSFCAVRLAVETVAIVVEVFNHRLTAVYNILWEVSDANLNFRCHICRSQKIIFLQRGI